MEYIELIIAGISGTAALVSGITAKVKSRINACKEACKKAVEKAEELKNATGEQKKAYAMAIVRQTIRYFSNGRISRYIEEFVSFSNQVNVKKNEREIY